MTTIDPRFDRVDLGEVTLRIATVGEGPLVLLVHGFPESWFSWRHQMGPIASAGYKVAAIDVRGYGGSDKPDAISAYSIEALTGDIARLASTLSPGEPPVIVGHDWGAPVVYATALSQPQTVRAVAGLAIPYSGIPERPFNEVFEETFTSKGRFFYQHWFAEPGLAEREAESDVRGFLRRFYYALSAGGPPWPKKSVGATLLEGLPDPDCFPAWLREEDLDYYVKEFKQSGFRGPMNRYRNHVADFRWYAQFRGRKIEQPALFIGGTDDPAMYLHDPADPLRVMRHECTDLRRSIILPDCGHWTQQEQPEAVTDELLGWLARL